MFSGVALIRFRTSMAEILTILCSFGHSAVHLTSDAQHYDVDTQHRVILILI